MTDASPIASSGGGATPPSNAQFYDTIARYYDAENAAMTDDLLLYSDLAADLGGPLLDIGCGSGRVLLHLAQEGYPVVGVDHSPVMLARGRRRLESLPDAAPLVRWIAGDILTVALAEQFPLVLLPYNAFMHFTTQADQLALLRRCRRWLAPDGQIVLDLPHAGDAYATVDDSSLMFERTFAEPESGHWVMQQSVSRIDRAAQMLHVTWIYDEIGGDGTVRRTLAPLDLRYVFPAEMELLLAAAGLVAVEWYGDYNLTPFEDGSPRMIVIAEHADTDDTDAVAGDADAGART